MRRREFSKVALLSAAAPALVAHAQAPTFKEGQDYLKLASPAPVDAPAGKVEVIEFFGYWCPHCAKFEPTFNAWVKKQPAHVVVRRNPIAFSPAQEPLQRLYFALEAMGKVDELHGKVFVAIHGERQKFTSADDVANWAARQGLDRSTFLSYYNAFAVAGKLRRAAQLAEAYKLDGVPALGVAGRYFTSPSQAGSEARVLAVVDHLVEASRKG